LHFNLDAKAGLIYCRPSHGKGPALQRANSIAKQTATRALWSVEDDIQACRVLNQAAVRALIILSPALMSSEDTSIDEDVIRASRIDPLAAQRVLDILQDLSGRLERALVQADWEAELENAIVEAAKRLPPLGDKLKSDRKTG
jgi:hypothetical protein